MREDQRRLGAADMHSAGGDERTDGTGGPGPLDLLEAVADRLNRADDFDQVLEDCVRSITTGLGSGAGWVMLEQEPGGDTTLAACVGLSSALAADDYRAMRGDCRCLSLLRMAHPGTTPAVVECERLAAIQGGPAAMCRHASALIRASGRYVGSLNILVPADRDFSDNELRLLSAVADLIGMALDRVRVSETQRERSLYDLTRTVSSTLDLSTILTSVVRMAARMIGADGGAMALVSLDRATITYPFLFNLPLGLRLLPQPRGTGLAWHCVETGESVLLDDYCRHPNASPRWVEAGVHAFIGVPLVAGEDRIGALGLFSKKPEKRFDARDLALVESIGLQAGVAIQNARLYEATRRQLEELAALRAVAVAGTEASNEEALIGRAADIAGGVLHVAGFDVLLIEQKDGVMRPHPSVPASAGHPSSALPIDGAVAGRVAANGKPHRTTGPTSEAEIDLMQGEAPPSQLCVPLKVSGNVMGVLRAVRPALDSFTEADERLLVTIAGQLATALERLRAESALRESEERFRRLAENAHDVIYRYRFSPVGAFDYISPAAALITGYNPQDFYDDPELAQKAVFPEDLEILRGMPEHDPGKPVLLRWVRKDGGIILMEHRIVQVRDANGNLVAVEGIARDVTERKRLEDQLRQSQKMDAIGRLAGGVAHDFNNLLTVILNCSEQQLKGLDPVSPLRRAANEIKKAAERAAALTRQLLTFSRKQVVEPRVVDLNDIVTQMSTMLRRLIGENIDLATVLSPSPCLIRADPGQIEQVILNLAINSRDAMPGGGLLRIVTGDVHFDEAEARRRGAPAPGRYVSLTVSDTGSGMDSETLSRIFEPFFTTKVEGTGLGMSTIYGIVQQSGGAVSVESALGEGTTCRLYLPRIEELAAMTEVSTVGSETMRGSETVLLVEDEDAVRSLVREILELDGYAVIEARDGAEALVLTRKHSGPIDLLLTDVVMPGMSGRELAEQLTRARPTLKVLYTSGYTDDAVLRHGVLADGQAFLQKPFDRECLGRKLRTLLRG